MNSEGGRRAEQPYIMDPTNKPSVVDAEDKQCASLISNTTNSHKKTAPPERVLSASLAQEESHTWAPELSSVRVTKDSLRVLQDAQNESPISSSTDTADDAPKISRSPSSEPVDKDPTKRPCPFNENNLGLPMKKRANVSHPLPNRPAENDFDMDRGEDNESPNGNALGLGSHVSEEDGVDQFRNAVGTHDIPDEGERVYARFHKDDMWYWGKVTKKYTNWGKYFFNVEFDDGDKRRRAPLKDLVGEQVFLRGRTENKATQVKETSPVCADVESPSGFARGGGGRIDVRKNPTEEIKVGTRCYARFTNGFWYWGQITKIQGLGKDMTCEVLFDDGDSRDNVSRYDEIYTEAEMGDSPSTSNHINSIDMEKRRCRKCKLCRSPDCGKCPMCVRNSNSTSIYKESCLVTVCSKIPVHQRMHQVPFCPDGWRYYFVHSSERPAQVTLPLHPNLAGLRVLSPNPKVSFWSMEAASRRHILPPETVQKAAKELYENHLGLKIRQVAEHFLVNRGYARQWLTAKGEPRHLYGTIVACEVNQFDENDRVFKVRYNPESRNLVSQFALAEREIPPTDEVSEAMAWSGCLLHEENTSVYSIVHEALDKHNLTFVKKWLIPNTYHIEIVNDENGYERPKITMVFRGFRLELEVRPSLIKNAGLGVFIRCTSMVGYVGPCFRLEEGELLDIGYYAPVCNSDAVPTSVLLAKNLIHDWEVEAWSFDIPNDPGGGVYDITSDSTGELHDVAMRSVASYVNETDGHELPSIRADYDPHGAVHYLLGHDKKGDGPLKLPIGVNEWKELKIDYGPAYERVRVRKKYSRLPPKQRAEVERSIERDDEETLKDIDGWSVEDVELSLEFLERLQFPSSSPKVAKALLVAMRLLQRLNDVKNLFHDHAELQSVDFCDNGYSTMSDRQLINRTKDQGLRFLELLDSDDLKTQLGSRKFVDRYIRKWNRHSLDRPMSVVTAKYLLECMFSKG